MLNPFQNYNLNNLETKVKQKPKRGITQRGEIIKEYLTIINEEREGTKYKPAKYKPATFMSVAMRLQLLKTNHELLEFLSICKDYRNRNGSFGKRFWGNWGNLNK